MQKTIFEIRKMDCPSEENLIRMKLEGASGIRKLDFDIENRKLAVFHTGQKEPIEKSIHSLNLGDRLLSSEVIEDFEIDED